MYQLRWQPKNVYGKLSSKFLGKCMFSLGFCLWASVLKRKNARISSSVVAIISIIMEIPIFSVNISFEKPSFRISGGQNQKMNAPHENAISVSTGWPSKFGIGISHSHRIARNFTVLLVTLEFAQEAKTCLDATLYKKDHFHCVVVLS